VLERIGSLDLRDDEWVMPEVFRGGANGVHVGRRLDEGLAHGIDSLPERELETGTIVFGEGANAEINSGKIQSFSRTQLAADRDGALNIVPRSAIDYKLHEPVVQVKAIARLHCARQAGEGHRHAPRISDDVVAR
jgi:hypothetical protein